MPGRGYYEHAVLGPIEQTRGWDGIRGWELGPMFIDRETKLLTRSTMTVPIPTVAEASIVTDVGGYTPVAGVMMSTTMTQVVEGIAATTVTVDDTFVNTAVDAKIFASR